MKKHTLLFMAGAMLAVTSCSKKSSSTTTTPTSPTSGTNTVTITDGGSTYTETGAQFTGVTCELDMLTSYASFTLETGDPSNTTAFPVSINLSEINGPLSGLGTFTVADTPTGYTVSGVPIGYAYQGTVTEVFSGGQEYNIDTTTVNITTASGNTIVGTYRLHLTNSSSNKVITGTINCKQAIIE